MKLIVMKLILTNHCLTYHQHWIENESHKQKMITILNHLTQETYKVHIVSIEY